MFSLLYFSMVQASISITNHRPTKKNYIQEALDDSNTRQQCTEVEMWDKSPTEEDALVGRDGHGIPKCSPCPSVFFYHWIHPFVSVLFLGGEYVCPSYGPLKI